MLSFAVTLCCVLSSNFQVTFVPFCTVRLPGVKLKFFTTTVGAAPLLAELDCVFVPEPGLLPPQPASRPTAATTARTRLIMITR